MLTPAQHDRSAAVLLGLACGDALGAGYEFAGPLPANTPVSMRGGGGFHWTLGEWTDYTAMAVPIATAASKDRNLAADAVLDEIVAEWAVWARSAPYTGIQLGAVLSGTEPTAAGIRRMAREQHDRTGRSAGSGSLLRTAPVALACLDDPAALAEVARLISELTHVESDAGDACVLFGLALRHAVLEGEIDLRIGLDLLPPARRDVWAARLAEAAQKRPADFPRNGWVVQTLQAAWSAISHTEADAGQLRRGVEAAVRGGGDTDAVAAAAGALLAARWGLAAVPESWRRLVKGWPGLRGPDLVSLAVLSAHGRRFGEDTEPLPFRLHVVR
ncbi:ADP-ribosylglycohydrolase family protein [Cryobacterium algoritolerans]|uniref:ADP-ribosylglycohydrolase family protein n=1 Tax=Cryobacterium algoritolerans TaxID=1259184 RepID=A0A4R8WZN1_9MICO|nr:ADP-ribosylglycohydrolase family protein [Cryobacterium algoritolerans]TFC21216.1 ADP-ribosylglycohydrolase family protein [Cryobacterium algoritolerans]